MVRTELAKLSHEEETLGWRKECWFVPGSDEEDTTHDDIWKVLWEVYRYQGLT